MVQEVKRSVAEVIGAAGSRPDTQEVTRSVAEVIGAAGSLPNTQEVKRSVAEVMADAGARAPGLTLPDVARTEERTLIAALHLAPDTVFSIPTEASPYHGIAIRPYPGGLATITVGGEGWTYQSVPLNLYSRRFVLTWRVSESGQRVDLRINGVVVPGFEQGGGRPGFYAYTALGGVLPTPGDTMRASLAEVIVFASAVSDTSIDILEGYIVEKWMLRDDLSQPVYIGQPVTSGFYVGNSRIGANNYALIMAGPESQQTLQWSITAGSVPGTQSRVDGVANTDAMVAAGEAMHPAAAYCYNYTGGEVADWFLPAIEDLKVFWANNRFLSAIEIEPQRYTSSTEATNNLMAAFDASIGEEVNSGKTLATRTRPFRRILLEEV